VISNWIWWLPIGKAPEIAPEQLNKWLEEGKLLQLIDSRTAIEFHQGTLQSAKHAPVTGLPGAINRLDLDTGKPVVVLCLSGHRSLPGTRFLKARGFEAYSLKGGLSAWKLKGYSINKRQRLS
jgi:rhodanese-related sulfurtransferase